MTWKGTYTRVHLTTIYKINGILLVLFMLPTEIVMSETPQLLI